MPSAVEAEESTLHPACSPSILPLDHFPDIFGIRLLRNCIYSFGKYSEFSGGDM